MSQTNTQSNAKRKNARRILAGGVLMIYDYIAVLAAFFLALWVRFDCRYSAIPKEKFQEYLATVFFYAAFVVIVHFALRLYHSLWRYASYSELLRLGIAAAVSLAGYVGYAFVAGQRMPNSYYVFGIVMQFVFTTGIRFLYRFIMLLCGHQSHDQKRVMLIGAGSAGVMILRDIKQARETKENVVCIIDDDPAKQRLYIDGVRVVGGRDHIMKAAHDFKVDKIYLAIPSASVQTKRDILNICKETNCELKNLPGMYQIAGGQVYVSQMRDVAVEDLLGRDPIHVDMREIFNNLTKKVIMVTGGGGSIGSELCRQIASHDPKQLIIFDVYENNAYDIQQELKKKYPKLDLQVIIGSVRDSRKIFQVFEDYRPQIVYHAAAHKHVPLMEDSPCEAIKNNAIGTYKTAYAAITHGCERFVLISTDKAVNPTNIMGASKRLCEMIIQAFDAKLKQHKAHEIPQLFTHYLNKELETPQLKKALSEAKTEFVAVRFGNVLGSSGSVIPLFKKQIAAGGPVTVTHPDIIRYFMTIPEAVSLVLTAGNYAKGGEIFVLDMGVPVKIDDLARNLIRLSGYTPNEDIMIEYTGLRPGEKLYEEKLMAEEGMKKTKNDLIHIGNPIPFDIEEFLGQLNDLMDAAYKNSPDIKRFVQGVVKTYHPQ